MCLGEIQRPNEMLNHVFVTLLFGVRDYITVATTGLSSIPFKKINKLNDIRMSQK